MKKVKSTKDAEKVLSKCLNKKNYAKLVKTYLKKKKDIVCSQQLADEIGCCKDTVRDAIHQLIRNGEPIATFWGKGHKYTTSLIEHQHCLEVSKRVTDAFERRNIVLSSNIEKISAKSNITKLSRAK